MAQPSTAGPDSASSFLPRLSVGFSAAVAEKSREDSRNAGQQRNFASAKLLILRASAHKFPTRPSSGTAGERAAELQGKSSGSVEHGSQAGRFLCFRDDRAVGPLLEVDGVGPIACRCSRCKPSSSLAPPGIADGRRKRHCGIRRLRVALVGARYDSRRGRRSQCRAFRAAAARRPSQAARKLSLLTRLEDRERSNSSVSRAAARVG
jgi:hypothetical protein